MNYRFEIPNLPIIEDSNKKILAVIKSQESRIFGYGAIETNWIFAVTKPRTRLKDLKEFIVSWPENGKRNTTSQQSIISPSKRVWWPKLGISSTDTFLNDRLFHAFCRALKNSSLYRGSKGEFGLSTHPVMVSSLNDQI